MIQITAHCIPKDRFKCVGSSGMVHRLEHGHCPVRYDCMHGPRMMKTLVCSDAPNPHTCTHQREQPIPSPSTRHSHVHLSCTHSSPTPEMPRASSTFGLGRGSVEVSSGPTKKGIKTRPHTCQPIMQDVQSQGDGWEGPRRGLETGVFTGVSVQYTVFYSVYSVRQSRWSRAREGESGNRNSLEYKVCLGVFPPLIS